MRVKAAIVASGNAGKKGATWLFFILVVHVFLSATYWYYTPYGAPPDESPHGRYVHALAANGKPPVFDASDRENYEYHQPPLYYALGVPFYYFGRAIGMNDPASAVRLLSLLLGGISVLAIYLAVRSAFPNGEWLAVGSAGFAALLPTHVMLSSSVSNDILLELVFGLMLLMVSRMLVGSPSWGLTVGLGLVFGVGLLAKTTAVLLVPITLLAYLLALQRRKLTAKSMACHVGAALGIGAVIGGWWLVRNQILYGDLLAMRQFESVFQDTAKPEWFIQGLGWSWGEYVQRVAAWTFASFWGVFGHMDVFMPAGIYYALGTICVIVAIGSIKAGREMRAGSTESRDIFLVYMVTIALVFLAFLKFNTSFFQAQGRYLYPALLPISALWTLGVAGVLPRRRRYLGVSISLVVPLLAQVVAISTCVVPEMPYYL